MKSSDSTAPAASSFESKADELLRRAERAAEDCVDWTEIHNAVFAPGVLSESFPDRAGRERFVASPQYRRIMELSEAVRRAGRDGLPSGRFVVRLPRSLHASLAREAAEEGVSLNQLVVSKVAATPFGSAGHG